MQKAIIIGAGIAGIATSIRLAAKGYEVHVYERNSYPGGKLTSIEKGNFRFDAGPSLFTLPKLVTELFDLCGEASEEHFSYIRKDVICNYFWDDGFRYSMPSDVNKLTKSISLNFNIDESKILKYINRSKDKYKLTNSIFIEKSLHKLSTYFSFDALKAFFLSYKLDLFKSLHSTNHKSFKNEKLTQLFDRFATYNGSSPFKTSGILSMIPYLEMGLGTYFPNGGMKSITNSLYELALRQGVNFHFNQMVDEIIVKKNETKGVRIQNSNIASDLVISNMDIFSTYHKLLPNLSQPNRILNQERSSSALIFYWGIKGVHPELDLHNILFSTDYEGEFAYIFEKKDIHHDPTVYINISSKCNSSDAPEGSENWFVMINAPGDIGQDWDTLIATVKQNVINKISRVLKIDLESIIVEESILDPRLIATRTQSHQGSLYGTSSNNRYSAFYRHPNFSNKIKNLYFVGGSVHPGGGIPLCLNSAKIVSNLI
ncbi:MAG: phytoene desaturase [Saprospiraceae bacterium]|jgi:phytoene desaturase|tara:strand:- start:387 stop:1844 length:1458 start_codon:yes stop_codon:yes gene_type:complete